MSKFSSAILFIACISLASCQPDGMGGGMQMGQMGGMGAGMAQMGGMASGGGAMSPSYPGDTQADSSYYTNQPAPSPGSCPAGTLNATLTAEMTQGPYYLTEDLFRQNVTEGQLGLALEVRITVLDTDCNPVEGAFVDIWHCNATGTYSGYTSMNPGGNVAPARRLLQSNSATDNSTFNRGTTITDANGLAVFYTNVPGWYTGRAVHVHNMVHIPTSDVTADNEDAVYVNQSYVSHVGQYFFEDELLTEVFSLYPYTRHTGDQLYLDDDDIYEAANDEHNIFTIEYVDPTDLSAGLIGSVTAVIDPDAQKTLTPVGGGGGGGMPGGISPAASLPQGSNAMGPQPQLPQVAGRRMLAN